jgi:YHS domain-containing protein
MIPMRLSIFISMSLFTFLGWSQPEFKEPVYSVKGLAISGYDPVAYFTLGTPTKGIEIHSYNYLNTKWLFKSNEHLELFKKNPEKYLPQYGGYCAFGMKEGYKAKTDPVHAWTIHNGKLFLNYNKAVQNDWLPQKEPFIKLADENWKNFKHD